MKIEKVRELQRGKIMPGLEKKCKKGTKKGRERREKEEGKRIGNKKKEWKCRSGVANSMFGWGANKVRQTKLVPMAVFRQQLRTFV